MRRIITTRLPEYNLEAKHWLKESQDIWGLASISEVIVSHVFDFSGLSGDDFKVVCGVLESDLNSLSFEIPKNNLYFHIKAVDGQFDDTLERTLKLINNFSKTHFGENSSVYKNREFLYKHMKDAGFIVISNEWWHFQEHESNDKCRSKGKLLDF